MSDMLLVLTKISRLGIMQKTKWEGLVPRVVGLLKNEMIELSLFLWDELCIQSAVTLYMISACTFIKLEPVYGAWIGFYNIWISFVWMDSHYKMDAVK
jgi:hypothetical protein